MSYTRSRTAALPTADAFEPEYCETETKAKRSTMATTETIAHWPTAAASSMPNARDAKNEAKASMATA